VIQFGKLISGGDVPTGIPCFHLACSLKSAHLSPGIPFTEEFMAINPDKLNEFLGKAIVDFGATFHAALAIV
jgi:hypothetical protein